MYGKIGNVELGLCGDYALFVDPSSKQTGHPSSYPYPVAGQIDGILQNIYRHPVGEKWHWSIDNVRIMNRIEFGNTVNRFEFYKCGKNARGYDCTKLVTSIYLKNVDYQIKAHYQVWGDKEQDNDLVIKADNIIERRIRNKSPYYDIYFGRAECEARLKNTRFGEGSGYYDNSGEILLCESGFVGFKYPVGDYNGEKLACFAPIKMVDGIITFPKLEECTYTKVIKEY